MKAVNECSWNGARVKRRNSRLAAVIAETGWSHAQVARAFVRVAMESGAKEFLGVGRSHVSHWVGGSKPSGRGPQILREALSRRLGRFITLDAIGLPTGAVPSQGALAWDADTLAGLTDLGRVDVDPERRRVLAATAYSLAALALPSEEWWARIAGDRDSSSASEGRSIGRGDVDAVRDMASMFSRMDQRRGGGHARTAVVQYLMSDVAPCLRGKFSSDQVRRAMFCAASELAYLSGWMAFDNAEHAIAQNYFTVALKLAAESGDQPMAGHILRAMAHQALDLGHARQALDLANASVEGDRYTLASSRERALFGVIHARSLTVTGQAQASAVTLNRAENALGAAQPGDEEPGRVFFFGEASLAHETACALRDLGDLPGAERQFRRSVRTRKIATFTRTHAVTLGYLGAVQARQGSVEQACATWSKALDTMDGIRSGRTRQVATDIRSALSPFHQLGVASVTDVDARAAAYLREVV